MNAVSFLLIMTGRNRFVMSEVRIERRHTNVKASIIHSDVYYYLCVCSAVLLLHILYAELYAEIWQGHMKRILLNNKDFFSAVKDSLHQQQPC